MILADGNRAAFLPLILDRLTQADGLGWDCSRLWRFKSRSRSFALQPHGRRPVRGDHGALRMTMLLVGGLSDDAGDYVVVVGLCALLALCD